MYHMESEQQITRHKQKTRVPAHRIHEEIYGSETRRRATASREEEDDRLGGAWRWPGLAQMRRSGGFLDFSRTVTSLSGAPKRNDLDYFLLYHWSYTVRTNMDQCYSNPHVKIEPTLPCGRRGAQLNNCYTKKN
jgi:hypothetical protein